MKQMLGMYFSGILKRPHCQEELKRGSPFNSWESHQLSAMAAAFHLHSGLPGTKGTGNRQWRKQQAESSKYQAWGSLQLTEMPSGLQNKTLQDSICKLL